MTYDEAVIFKKAFRGFPVEIDNDHSVVKTNPEYDNVKKLYYVRVTQNNKKGVTTPRSFIIKDYDSILEVGLGDHGIGIKRFNGNYVDLVVNCLRKV